jgi:septum site-determining protein MinD
MAGTTLALVGTTGGAGTTRLTVEIAATVARTGRDVAVLDAAFGTQGLRRYVNGRPQPDVTAVVTEDYDLGAALLPVAVDAPGNVAIAPASAPFDRVARAKTASAARAFEESVASAARGNDVVLIDTPPVAANQAVAAVSAADRVAAVAPDSPRGRDGLALLRGRLEDVGVRLDAIVATATEEPCGEALAEPDVRVPSLPGSENDVPTSTDPTAAGARDVARAVERTLGVTLEVTHEDDGGLSGFLRRE